MPFGDSPLFPLWLLVLLRTFLLFFSILACLVQSFLFSSSSLYSLEDELRNTLLVSAASAPLFVVNDLDLVLDRRKLLLRADPGSSTISLPFLSLRKSSSLIIQLSLRQIRFLRFIFKFRYKN